MKRQAILNIEFLSKTEAIQYRPGLEGQTVLRNGTVLLGNKAGPGCSLKYLCHEMAHLVEIDDARMRSLGWGLSLPEVCVLGQTFHEPNTCQPTKREIRVIAYQVNLQRYLGIKEPISQTTDALQFMPDSACVPLEDGRSAYGEDKDESLDYAERKASQHRWVINQVTSLLEVNTFDRFVNEWFRKIKWLEETPYVDPFANNP